MSFPVLQVTNLTKHFGEFVAVNDVSFAIKPGEILGLLGPNGAGKTTTIHMLLGLITPTAGSISMFGLDLATQREQILQAVNFSSTYISLPLALTVEENLWVVARLYGMSDIARRIDEVVKKLEMEEFRHKITRKLSSGQMTRLTLAKAFLTEPRILFLDEPTAGMTREETAEAIKMIDRVTSGRTLVIIEHDMDVVFSLADTVSVLHYGSILASGPPEEIKNDQRVKDAYLGEG